MTAVVRLFAHAGMVALPIASYSGQQSFHANFALKQPYLSRQMITADTGGAQTSNAALSDSEHTKLLRVEIQPGKRVHYEVTPAGATLRVADTSSPILEGNDALEFHRGWLISLLEAS